METTFWDIKTGDIVTASGKAQNAYEIISKSEKKICMRNVKNNVEHCMETNQFFGHVSAKRLLLEGTTAR